MVSLVSLWLPILLASVLVFGAAFLMWMVLPHHRSDWKTIPEEEILMHAIRQLGVGRGQYIFPHAMSREGAGDADLKRQLEEGPVGSLILREPGSLNMGKNLLYYFLFTLGVSFSVAYVASRTLPAGSDYLAVFRIVATVAFLAYAAAEIPNAIWFGRTWSSTWKNVLDGFVYGLLTGGAFGAFWPG